MKPGAKKKRATAQSSGSPDDFYSDAVIPMKAAVSSERQASNLAAGRPT
jgi:hypothetical protein